MGQIMSEKENRVEFDEEDDNGLILSNIYIPEELITELMLYYTDGKTLANCQLVCKRWNTWISEYLWRKKAEISTGLKFSPNGPLRWQDYQLIYRKSLFARNFVKNHSGIDGVTAHWVTEKNGGNGWRVECPPTGAPSLPDEPGFHNSQHCFATSYGNCQKWQMIDLLKEGFTENILDNYRPPIEVNNSGIMRICMLLSGIIGIFILAYLKLSRVILRNITPPPPFRKIDLYIL